MANSERCLAQAKPEQRISKVARRAIRQRLDTLVLHARRARKRWKQSSEHVHQFRVATRRARAALRTFSRLLPAEDARSVRKMLKRFRNAAGTARDLDVLEQRLRESVSDFPDGPLKTVLPQIREERRKAQFAVSKVCGKRQLTRFEKQSRRLLRSVRWPTALGPEPSMGQVARELLQPPVAEFFEASQQDLSQVESLHQMRIAGKRVRYALELLGAGFDLEERRHLYEALVAVQDKLGALNDHCAAVTRLTAWRERAKGRAARDALTALIEFEQSAVERSQAAFRDWWSLEQEQKLRSAFGRAAELDEHSSAEPVAAKAGDHSGS